MGVADDGAGAGSSSGGLVGGGAASASRPGALLPHCTGCHRQLRSRHRVRRARSADARGDGGGGVTPGRAVRRIIRGMATAYVVLSTTEPSGTN